jgi:hypothetical protein
MAVGTILASANKVTGSPIIQVGTAADNQPSQKMLIYKVNEIVLKKFPGFTIISEKVVCYSYPKMGFLVELSNSKNQNRKKIILDAMNPEEVLTVPDQVPGLSTESIMWSYLNEISEKKKAENLIQWDNTVGGIRKITDTDSYKQIQDDFTVTSQNIAVLKPELEKTRLAGQLKLINYGYFPTTQQLGTYFCNIGTAQIITTYYWMVGVVPAVRNQEAIARKMDAWPNGGPTWANEENYYRDSWSNGGLGIDQYRFYEYGPSFTTIQEQVDANQPFKIGLGPHARACYGYDSSVSPTRIYFSDPGTGTKYYETLQTYNNHLRMNIPYP